jgi:hypothetical protein
LPPIVQPIFPRWPVCGVRLRRERLKLLPPKFRLQEISRNEDILQPAPFPPEPLAEDLHPSPSAEKPTQRHTADRASSPKIISMGVPHQIIQKRLAGLALPVDTTATKPTASAGLVASFGPALQVVGDGLTTKVSASARTGSDDGSQFALIQIKTIHDEFRISAIGGILGYLVSDRSRSRVPFKCRDHEAAKLSE